MWNTLSHNLRLYRGRLRRLSARSPRERVLSPNSTTPRLSHGVVVHPRVVRGPLSRGGALPAPWTLGSKSIQNRGTKSIQKFIRSTSNLATRQIGSNLGTQANPAAGVESWDGPVECDIGKTQIPKRLDKTLPSPKSVTGVSSADCSIHHHSLL